MLDLVSELSFPSLAKVKLSTKIGGDKADLRKNLRGLTGPVRQRTTPGNPAAQGRPQTVSE
ncbi:hypothetical protein NIM87_04290 [Devosia sp. XJ19-1]|uniref:Uncharacterized protein n=1 Tax=Devosia ureilytica TaxID=2952754 RepID=A0A9Q4AML9_9HYPH|nr:hypothetical protein [Devosia ureilytica]MCP8882708.1 hypothetical protein [Devosia ureilytica]MCP8886924.1 hypothetical protein [Devosia ureilytica]